MMIQPIWVVLVAALLLFGATVVWAIREWPARTRRGRAPVVTRLLVTGAAVVIGLHPVGAVRVEIPQERTVDIVFVIDRTTSMGAQDFDGDRPRMTGATADLSKLVESNSGAHVAVVVFDDDGRLAVPFTTNATTVATFLSTVGWRPSAKASGSDISIAAELVEQVLRKSEAERPSHDRYLVYAGDGEQTAESAPESFASVAELIDGAIVLGYGTAAGGPMALSDDSDELITLDDEVQKSRIDEAALKKIADELGGEYQHRTDTTDLPELIPAATVSSVTELVPGREYYWIVALAAALGLLHLVAVSVIALRVVREEVAHAPAASTGA